LDKKVLQPFFSKSSTIFLSKGSLHYTRQKTFVDMLKFGCKTIAMFKNNNFGNGGPSMVHPGGGNNGTNPSPLL
jgi:hypothetical protein